ncbi:HAD-IIIA family hydrolase [Terrilactibacillus sp. BCM23-1]|uniref:HAD-IIIA family hydrolase n=2 Tax=Terrilactibacillus tamarindi TaxID=2599694 RepID=A0A6N8CU13_9BACI|nr:HAD-IIIA family hydrolase [Terrilactibacillus tamarindi]
MSSKIKLIVLDVDGVLTDGKLIIGTNHTELKAFHSQDGMGITLARHAGIQFAIITGRKSDAVRRRAKELSIDYLYEGISDKIQVFENLLNELNISHEEVCFIGDDINDLLILKQVGLACAPKDAVDMVKRNVHYITKRSGGEGAVREVIDRILTEQFDYDDFVMKFLQNKIEVKQ